MKADRSVPKRPVALLDVDETLIVQAPGGQGEQFNDVLIQALKEQGVNDIYLFTNMALRQISLEYQSIKDGLPYLSRVALINHLKRNGFQVHGVITPPDPAYDQGLGRAFDDIFMPQYNRFLVNGQVKQDAPDASAEIRDQDGDLYKQHERFKQLAVESKGQKDEKAAMYAYFFQNKPEWVSSVVYVDDRASHLTAVAQEHARLSSDFLMTPINIKDKKLDLEGALQPHRPTHLNDLDEFRHMIESFKDKLPDKWKILYTGFEGEHATREEFVYNKKDEKAVALKQFVNAVVQSERGISAGDISIREAWRSIIKPQSEALRKVSADKTKNFTIFGKVVAERKGKVGSAIDKLINDFEEKVAPQSKPGFMKRS